MALIFEDTATRHAALMARCMFNLGVIWVHESCTASLHGYVAIYLKDNEWTYEQYCSAACSLRDTCKLRPRRRRSRVYALHYEVPEHCSVSSQRSGHEVAHGQMVRLVRCCWAAKDYLLSQGLDPSAGARQKTFANCTSFAIQLWDVTFLRSP